MRLFRHVLRLPGTLRGRLAMGASLLVGGIALAVFLYIPVEMRRQALEGLDARGRTLASLAAVSVAPAVRAEDSGSSLTQLAGLRALEEVTHIEIVLRDGSALLSLGRPPSEETVAADGARIFTSPVKYGSETLGELRFGMDTSLATDQLRGVRASLATFLLLVALVGILGARYLGRSLSQPMRTIADVAREVTGGRMELRAPTIGLEEPDELIRAFNAMVDKVSEGQRELRESNLFLEARVTARTRKLEAEVAERRRAEQANSLLATAVEQSAEIHTIYDDRGLILYTNRAFEEVSGFRSHEVRGKSGRELWNTPAAGTAWWDMWSTVRGGAPWKSRLSLRRADGEPYELMVTVSPVKGGGEAARYVSVAYDVTKESALEDQLRHAQKMEAVGRLAGGVAHDFNNLLTAILGYTESLQLELPQGESGHDDLEEIRKAAERAASLTSQLLAFSRRQSLQLEPVEVGEAIRDVERMMSRLIGTHIELRLDLPDEPAWIRADRGQLTQILLNLAVNARDAMADGGILEIVCHPVPAEHDTYATPPADRVVIHFTDTGHGIAPKYLDRVFEPFFTTKEPGSGTGLGLSTVFGIMDQLGGRIHVESEVGQGTSFRMVFPAIRPPSTPEECQEEEVEATGGGVRVLVVDDEPSVRQLVRRMLEDDGYRVEEAANGVQALGILHRESHDVDLVLSDVIMPGMNGVDLAREAEAVRPGLKVILMSGYTADALPEGDRTNSGYPLLGKPFRRSELRRALAASGAVARV